MTGELHYAVAVNPREQTIICNCGNINKLGDTRHLRMHHNEPAPAEIERLWRQAISYQKKLDKEA